MAVRFEGPNDSARGRDLVTRRLDAARTYFARNRDLLDTFNGHVVPLVERAIRANGLTLDTLQKESQEPSSRRENLRLLDVLTWHLFTDTAGVPLYLLTDPFTGKFDGAYLEAFRWDHRNFNELRALDQKPGVYPQAYLQLLNALRDGSRSVAEVARIFDCAELARVTLDRSGSIFALVTGSTVDGGLRIPRESDWAATQTNIAGSILGVHAGIGDVLGYHKEVGTMKDFAASTLYPGLVQNVMHELEGLSTSIYLSNRILTALKTEVELELKKAKIEAHIEIREEGKSLGSLALKAKLTFEELLRSDPHYMSIRNDLISVNLRDPRRDSLDLEVSIKGVPREVRLEDDYLVLFVANEAIRTPLIFLTSTSVLMPLQHITNDFAAGRLIVSSYSGSTDEQHLIRAIRKIQNIILPKCIAKILKTFKMQNYRIKTRDYVSNPKPNGYQSVHVHVVSDKSIDSSFAPFEIQLRTKKMHNTSQLGGAAHALYKGEGAESQKVATAFLSTLEDSSKSVNTPMPVSDTTFSFTVLVNSDEPKMVQVREGTPVIDALVQAGVDLGKIAKVGLNLKGQSNGVQLAGQVTKDMEVEVRYVNGKKEDHLLDATNSMLIKHLGSVSNRSNTRSQLHNISKPAN